MLSIDSYSISNISKIEKQWRILEKGDDMTYFQTYDWNKMLAGIVQYRQKWIEVCFVLISDEDRTPLMIAPLLVYKKTHLRYNKKGVYFYGRQGWSDYLNFVYLNLTTEMLNCLFGYVKSQYGIDYFYLEQIKEATSTYQFIKKSTNIISEGSTSCVNLLLPDTITDYNKLLSKHTRQNIRTAYNRLQKDGLSISFVKDDVKADLDVCQNMRKKRVKQKKGQFFNDFTFLQKVKYRLWEMAFVQAPSFLPFKTDTKSKLLTAYINDEFCAFFNYGLDTVRKEIVVMAVGIDEKFAKYSPGLLLMHHYICSEIEEKSIVRVDFTRGNEPYKYHLGGSDAFIHHLEFVANM